MQRSKDHHWVPQFYLKRWADKNGKLVSFHRQQGRNLVRRAHPKSILCEEHLYTVFSTTGEHIYGEDTLLKGVDQDGTDALDFLTTGNHRRVPPDITRKLLRFMFWLAARHPSILQQFVRDLDSIESDVRERCGDPDYARSFFEDFKSRYASPKDRATFLMLLTAAASFTPAYKTLFEGLAIAVHDTSSFGQLLTSDHPLVSVPMFGDPDALYVLPISPTRVVLMCSDFKKLDFIRRLPDSRFVSYLNLLTIMFAGDYVYGTSNKDAAIIFQHLGLAQSGGEQGAQALMQAFRGELTVGCDLAEPYQKPITEEKATTNAAPVVAEELAAQQWFEQELNAADTNEKLRFYSESTRLDPNHSDVFLARGRVRADKGDLDGAFLDFSEAIRLNPESVIAYYNRGNVCSELEDWDVAIRDYSDAIRLSPSESLRLADAYVNRGNAHKSKGNFNSALDDYNQAIRINPIHPIAFCNRGDTRHRKEYLGSALEDYNEAIRINPLYYDAFVRRGNLQRTIGEIDLAIEDYNEAIRLNPNQAIAFVNRATARKAKGDIDEALEDYSRAIRLKSDCPITFYNRANALKDKGDVDGAIRDYSEAIRLDPKFVDAYVSRGEARKDKGDMTGAIRDFSEAARLDPFTALP